VARGSSTLLAITIHGLRDARSMSSTRESLGWRPAIASTTKRSRSASSIAIRTCRWISVSIWSDESSVSPPVSTNQKARPFHSARPKWRSRVVPASSLTIAE